MAIRRIAIDKRLAELERTALSIRKNETDQLTDDQANAIAHLRALANEEQAKWTADESKPTETARRGAADDDDLDEA
jgi:hypothetical protein